MEDECQSGAVAKKRVDFITISKKKKEDSFFSLPHSSSFPPSLPFLLPFLYFFFSNQLLWIQYDNGCLKGCK